MYEKGLLFEKEMESRQQRTRAPIQVKTCRCKDCKDPVFNDGMCWDHYKEEHYQSR